MVGRKYLEIKTTLNQNLESLGYSRSHRVLNKTMGGSKHNKSLTEQKTVTPQSVSDVDR